MKLNRLFRSPVAILAAIAVSASVFAFAAAITRPPAANPISAGQIKVTSLGYYIDDVKFTASEAEDPTATVSFTLTHGSTSDVIGTNEDNTSVKVKFYEGQPEYTTCRLTLDNLWGCTPTSSILITNVTELNVVAVSKE